MAGKRHTHKKEQEPAIELDDIIGVPGSESETIDIDAINVPPGMKIVMRHVVVKHVFGVHVCIPENVDDNTTSQNAACDTQALLITEEMIRNGLSRMQKPECGSQLLCSTRKVSMDISQDLKARMGMKLGFAISIGQ